MSIHAREICRTYNTGVSRQAVRHARNDGEGQGDSYFCASRVTVKIPYGISIQLVPLVSSMSLAISKEERQDTTADSRKRCNVLGYWLSSGSVKCHPIVLYVWMMRVTTFMLGRGGSVCIKAEQCCLYANIICRRLLYSPYHGCSNAT